MATPRKPKRFLTVEQKIRRVRADIDRPDHEGAAATELGVVRTVITRIRTVARDGAIAALQASTPGKPSVAEEEQSQMVGLQAEIARLERTIVEQAIELGCSGENRLGDDRSGPRPSRRDREGDARDHRSTQSSAAGAQRRPARCSG